MLGCCRFETEFGESRDGKVAFGSGKMGVGCLLVVALDVIEVGLWGGLGMLKIEGGVAEVR